MDKKKEIQLEFVVWLMLKDQLKNNPSGIVISEGKNGVIE